MLLLYSPWEVKALCVKLTPDQMPIISTFGEGTLRIASENHLPVKAFAPSPTAPSLAKAVDNYISAVLAGEQVDDVEFAENEQNEKVKAALKDIVCTPVSPELLPADDKGEIAQKTEDLVGPYELHDFFIYHFVVNGFAPSKILLLANIAFEGNYTEDVIKHWLKVFIRRFFAQQYKRSAVPDGPKVTAVSLSPRGSWMMPSDALSAEWLNDIE